MTDKELLALAEKAAADSYSPYSHFAVGAALVTADGSVYTGCNIENSSFSLTNCAERTAIFKAVSEKHKSFTAIAVVGGRNGDYSKDCLPCGACLQIMREFCGGDLRIILAGRTCRLDELMPAGFALE